VGTQPVPERSENPHILTQLSARENSIEFYRRESFNTYFILLRYVVFTTTATRKEVKPEILSSAPEVRKA